jgi:hypothetical protein
VGDRVRRLLRRPRIAVHLTLWFTVFQREIPERAQSRVSAYDSLGSFVLTPLGTAMAGPVAAGIGTKNAFWLSVAAILALHTSMLLNHRPSGRFGPWTGDYDCRMSRWLDGGDQERRCRLCRRRSGA